MNLRERLDSEIETCVNELDQMFRQRHTHKDVTHLLRDFVNAVACHLKSLPGEAEGRWIRATRTPDSDRQVLIYPGRYGQVSVGWYSSRVDAVGIWHDATEQYGDEGSPSMIPVTYWRSLPSGPGRSPQQEEK
jgi:hypothetical protein